MTSHQTLVLEVEQHRLHLQLLQRTPHGLNEGHSLQQLVALGRISHVSDSAASTSLLDAVVALEVGVRLLQPSVSQAISPF